MTKVTENTDSNQAMKGLFMIIVQNIEGVTIVTTY
jgi:hypothetical protein